MTDYDSMLPDLTPRGTPRATPDNIAEVLRRIGGEVRYNVDSERVELRYRENDYSHHWANYVRLLGELAKFNVPLQYVRGFLTLLSLENEYMPPEDQRRYRPDDRVWTFLRKGLDWSLPRKEWEWRSPSEIVRAAGVEATRAEATRVGMLVRRMNGWRSHRTMNKRYVLVPPIVTTRTAESAAQEGQE